MVSGTSAEHVPLGIGSRTVLVPEGWAPVQVDGGVLTGEPPSVAAPLAGGVAEEVARSGFAASVLFSVAGGDDELPAASLGPGQIWHDSVSDGPVTRLVVRCTEALGVPITSIHAWTVIDDVPLGVVATVDSRRLASTWPVMLRVLESLTPGSDRWEVLS